MNLFLKIGTWIEKRFPEKLTATDAKNYYKNEVDALNRSISTILQTLDNQNSELSLMKSDLTSLKAQTAMRKHSDEMIKPFAQRVISRGT